MPLSRRGSQRVSASIWPGFVDAMTALLLVLFFVLSIFMIVQFVLRDRITVQDSELDVLAGQVASLTQALGLSEARVDRLEGEVAAAGERAEEQASVIAGLTAELGSREAALVAAQSRITGFEAQVAGLLAERDSARAEVAELSAEQTRLIGAQEALQLALAQARAEIDAEAEAARLAAARAAAVEAALAEARNTIDAREATLAETLARLSTAEETGVAQAAALEALAEREAAMAEALSETEAARLAEMAAAEALRARLAGVETELSEAEATRLAEAAAAETLRARLREADAELTAMTLALEEQRRRAEETLTLLAAAEIARTEAEAEAAASLTEAERAAGLLAAARAALDAEEARSTEDQRRLALLNQQVAQLRSELGNLQALLEQSADRDLDAQVEIQALGSQLNLALARVAAEERRRAAAEAEARRLEEAERRRLEAEAQRLERYASEFFGRLVEVLAGREGVQVVGDRFVFSSEVLFPPARAELSPEGEAQIAGVVGLLREVSGEIPAEIDWILRVDGHTDNIPLAGSGAFADNWALSQARALSVVRYMTDALGFPPQRLAAAGFGEYRPVANNATEAGRAQNRRIELKLTER